MFQFNEKVFRLRLYQSIRVVYCAPIAAPQFFNAIRDSDPREVALCVNLFTTTQRVQFGRSVVAQSAAAQMCGSGTSQKQAQKKERFHVLVGAPLDKMDE